MAPALEQIENPRSEDKITIPSLCFFSQINRQVAIRILILGLVKSTQPSRELAFFSQPVEPLIDLFWRQSLQGEGCQAALADQARSIFFGRLGA